MIALKRIRYAVQGQGRLFTLYGTLPPGDRERESHPPLNPLFVSSFEVAFALLFFSLSYFIYFFL